MTLNYLVNLPANLIMSINLSTTDNDSRKDYLLDRLFYAWHEFQVKEKEAAEAKKLAKRLAINVGADSTKVIEYEGVIYRVNVSNKKTQNAYPAGIFTDPYFEVVSLGSCSELSIKH